MKIQIVQDRLRSGGTERQSILLAHAFREQGHGVQLLTFRPGGALAGLVGPVPHLALQPFDLRLDWFAPGLQRAVKTFAPSIVLCMGRMANSWGGSIQRKLSRDGSHSAVVATLRTGKRLPKMFNRSLREVRHIVANSDDARRRLLTTYQVPPEKVAVIHNALVFPKASGDAGEGSALRSSLRHQQAANDGTVVLLTVGMFRPEKNQRALIEMAAQLPREIDWQLWFVGDGPALAEAKQLAAARGCGDRVKFFGFQSDPRNYYSAADIAVLMSRSESLSNFLIEAHAHGLPSVAYDVMGVRECGGWAVPFGDEKSFRVRIAKLSQSPDERREVGLQMATFARTAFSPEKQAGEYLKLFSSLVGARA